MNKLKKLGVLLLAVIMLIQSGIVLVSAEEQKELIYADPEVKEIVTELCELDLLDVWVNDETFFAEVEKVKRADAAKALVKLLGYDSMVGGNNGMFYDVPDYHESAGAISVISSMGVMTGAGDGLFVPDGEILKSEFVKAIVYALGYGWRATYEGGYPTGYLTVAKRIGLLDGIEGDFSAPLTRAELVKILKNSLDVPIYTVVAVNGESIELAADKNETLLTYFHSIYTDEGVINSNRSVSLLSTFPANDESVIIGDTEVYVGDLIDVYDYVGYEVEYNYYYDKAAEKNYLMNFSLTDGNVVTELSWRDIASNSSSLKIVAYDENYDTIDYEIDKNATFIYNKERIDAGIKEKILNSNGNLRMVDGDDDGAYDVVFISNYKYDKVKSNSITRSKMLYGENEIHDFSATEIITVRSNGEIVSADDILAEDIVEITESADGKVVDINVILTSTAVNGVTVKEDSIIADDGTRYYYGKNLGEAHKTNIATVSSLNIILNSANEIVWTSLASTSDVFGYLIKVGITESNFSSSARIKMLTAAGPITIFECADKVMIDGVRVDEENVKATLKTIKEGFNTLADGEVSQLVKYNVNEKGEIRKISTAAEEDGLTIKINYSDYAADSGIGYRGWGYEGLGNFGGKYPSSGTAPIFNVPLTDQETADEKYFNVTKDIFQDISGIKYKIDLYTENPDKIDPCAFVHYSTAAPSVSMGNNDTGSIVLIEEMFTALNAEGMPVKKVAGWSGNSRSEWEVAMDDFPEVDSGDIGFFTTNALGAISDFRKLYDYSHDMEDGTQNGKNGNEESFDRSIEASNDFLVMLHVYNAPSDSKYFLSYKTEIFPGTTPPDSELQLYTFGTYKYVKKNAFHYDTKTGEIGVGEPPMIVGAKQDPVNYSRLIWRNRSNYLNVGILYY